MDLQFFIFIWRRHFKTARYKAYIKEWKAIELNPKVRLTCIVYYLFFPQLDTYFLMFFLHSVLILGRGPCSWWFGLCFWAAWQSWHGRAPPLLEERSLLVLLRWLPALETDGFGDDHVGPPSFILRLMGWQIFVEVWDSHITEVVSAGRDIILLWQYDMNVDIVECGVWATWCAGGGDTRRGLAVIGTGGLALGTGTISWRCTCPSDI